MRLKRLDLWHTLFLTIYEGASYIPGSYEKSIFDLVHLRKNQA